MSNRRKPLVERDERVAARRAGRRGWFAGLQSERLHKPSRDRTLRGKDRIQARKVANKEARNEQ